jgi:hypothetical protein
MSGWGFYALGVVTTPALAILWVGGFLLFQDLRLMWRTRRRRR